MDQKKQLPVITISRQYGAGGRSVARKLSEKLGIEFYDLDFVKLTAKISGYSEDEINREGEDMGRYAKFVNRFLTNASFSNPYDEIYQAQRAVILGLAEKPCIIVGRCSNIILREEGIESFDVFLTASREFRLKRAAELDENRGRTGPELEKYVDHRDQWRRIYFKSYTSHEMGEAADYHLCLDVSRFGIDRCVDLIAELV